MRPPPLVVVLLAATAAGCSTRTLQVGDLRATETALLTKNTLAATCTQYGDDGTPRSSTAVSSESSGDTAMMHEIFAGVGGLAAQLRPVPKPPGVGEPGRFGMQPGNGRSGAAACIGEHFQGEQAPFPPAPQQQSGQQSSAAPDEALQRRLELASRAADDTPELGPLPGDGP